MPVQAANTSLTSSNKSATQGKPASKPEEQEICPITQESIVDPVNLACGHRFGKAALDAWRKRHPSFADMSCPTCRQTLLEVVGVAVTVRAFAKGSVSKECYCPVDTPDPSPGNSGL